MNDIVFTSAEQKREVGKAYYFNKCATREEKDYGLKLIIEASGEKDPEAKYIVARLILDGVLQAVGRDNTDHALELMAVSANSGCIQARAFLNAYCEQRYRDNFDTEALPADTAGLVDFDGKPIKIDRTGFFTPIDAVLSQEEGRNILTLSANIGFVYTEDIPDPRRFEQAVFKGLLAWEGDYVVFGGQKLTVKVKLTGENKLFDNILIVPVSGEFGAQMKKFAGTIATEKRKEQIADIIDNRRSFAISGLKWSVNSRKIIYIQSDNDRFDDYEEIMHVAKHEFGHALGLGDLYANAVDSLGGVEKGRYTELDSYALSDNNYNLVMCDHHGPISNNDIEMVVLAFRENKEQLFQPQRLKGKISSALGKGN